MSERFRAILVDKSDKGDKGQAFRFAEMTEPELMEGDVTIAVEHSSVNYKDGLAITGKAPIIRRFPLIPGIDLAGVVISSTHDGFTAGDRVILNGWGVGESHHGGFAQRARVKGDWLVKMPEALDSSRAMAIGTAGYTAMLAVTALEDHGVLPTSGDVLVTGAAGGVGSIAIVLLAGLGYRVVASTGRLTEEPYLRSLGAAQVVDRSEFAGPVKPLAKARFAGAVDSVGSTTLANVLSQIDYGGAVAACGLAQGMDLPSSVAPFILRAVTLAGIDSVMCPTGRRERAWSRLARDLDLGKLGVITSQIPLDDVPLVAEEIVAGKVRGRVVVDL
ncbi:MAG: MDR family oxidoreductase [Aestuariivirgaceae bacterium]|jgi:acrylyl-CoA reductase (NADPH)